MKIKNNSYMPFIGKIFPLFFMLLFVNFGWGQVAIAGWEMNTLVNYGPSPFSATAASNVTVTGLTRGSGITVVNQAAGNAWGGNGTDKTNITDAIVAGDLVSFSVKANSGYTLSLSEIAPYNVRRSNSGSTTGQWQYSLDGTNFNNIATPITWGSITTFEGNPQGAISLTGISALQNVSAATTITIRIVLWGASSNLGTWYLNQFQAGSDLIFNGNVNVAGCSAPTTASSAYSFTNVTQTAMNVAFTSGNGAGRVVLMNTSNTFTAPTAGANPTANPVYTSGQQVVYNGTGNSFSVSGLGASTAYYYNIYEYCSPDRTYGAGFEGNQSTIAAASPVLSIAGTLAHGSSCIGIAATPVQYTITNSGGTAATGISISFLNPDFVVSGLSSNSIPPSGTATYQVTFTPSFTGAQTAPITIMSANATSVSNTLSGTGINTPATATTGNSAVTSTTANLAGSLTQGCSSITAYGIVYSTTAGFFTGTSVAATNLSAGSFNLVVSALQSNTTYYYKAYATDAIGTVYGTQSLFQTTTIGAPGANATVTSTGFTATWEAVPGATSYELDVYEKTAGSVATNLIISEYGEGNGGNKKYIEIFNGTGASVDLSNYKIWLSTNGGVWVPTTIPITGTLLNNKTYVIGNNTTDVIGADLYSGPLSYNGDDAVGLAYNGGAGTTFSLIDAVGEDSADPGTGWNVAGITNATVDKILIRKSSVLSPTTNWATSAGTSVEDSQWIVSSFTYNSTNQTTNLGSHTFAGGITNTYVIQNYNVGNILSYVVTGLNPSTHYFYVVRAKDANSTSTNSNEIEVTTLNFIDLTTYSAGSWDNGTPTATLNAVINDNYTTTGNLTAKSLTINQGKVFTVGSGHTLTVTNAIVNNSVVAGVDTFVMQNNAVLIQNSESSNTGTFTVKRNSADLYRLDYTLWSSPVSGQNLRSFSPATLFNRFYTYDTAAGTNGDYFQEIVTPADVNSKVFQVAKGYLIRMPNNWVENVNSNPAQPYLGAFRGNLNNGNLSIALSNATTKFNLVGNPYPSPISISAFFTANPDIAKTLYFWRKQNGANLSSGYATCNQLGVVTSDQTAVNGIDLFNTIKAGQGFFVKNNTAATLNFNNAMRTSAGGTFFFKSGTTDENQVHRFWLNLSNETSVVGQTLVGYTSGATQGVDAGLDALYFNDSPLALTTIINNEEYIIQGRSLPFVNTDVVPLGFKTNEAGTFTISLANFDGVFAENQDIYLKDNVTNTVQNLKTASYSFNAGAGVFNDRFEVQYYSALGTSNPELGGNNILIAVKNQQININAGSVVMNKIELIDISGRVIFTQENVNATTATIDNLTAANQMLIVRIITKENAVVNQKIVF